MFILPLVSFRFVFLVKVDEFLAMLEHSHTQRSVCFVVGNKACAIGPHRKRTAMATITSSTDRRQHNAIEGINTNSGQTIKSARPLPHPGW